MINIQSEVQKIHSKYGVSEKANYEIQLLCEQYANELHDTQVEKLNKPAVSRCEGVDGEASVCEWDYLHKRFKQQGKLRCKKCGTIL